MAFFLSSLAITSLLVVFFLSTSVPFTSGELGLLKETHLHLYYHEIYAGPNATTVAVAGPADNSTLFGLIRVVDDYLTECPDLASNNIIGRSQGAFTGVSQEEVAFHVVLNFVFTEGEFKGSTLSLYGRAVLESSTIELSIVGGDGQFLLARGNAVGKKLAAPAGTFLIEFDLFVAHEGPTATVF